jgi:hypothetical protein
MSELLRQRAQTALDTWIEEWAADKPPSAALTVSATIDQEQWQGQTCHQLRDANGALWIRANAADRARLTQCIFGRGQKAASGDVIEEITGMAALALAEELWSGLFGEASLPVAELVTHLPADLFAVGVGAVQMVCNLFDLRVVVKSLCSHRP